MEIKREISDTGAVTDFLILTEGENSAIDNATETLLMKYEAVIGPVGRSERDTLVWTLLGIMRDEGIQGVKEFAAISNPRKPRSHKLRSAGYASCIET